ncbi:MAG: aldo/keto reductase [Pseudomonadota bacterium]
MKTRTFGADGPALSMIGLGCMGMSDFYGPSDRQESIATIHAAVDAGITLLDTGDFYGSGHNEMLIAEALKTIPRDKVFIAVKFGALRDPDGGFVGFDASPAAVRNFLAMSLRRLGTDYIDLYQPARVTPAVPIEDTVGAIKDMVQAGYVRHIGLSEAGSQTVRKANAVHRIASLQIEYSLLSRSIETGILATCRELGITLNAYGVLSRGLLSGHWKTDRLSQDKPDFRSHLPRFSGENANRNLALVDALRPIAESKSCTVAQLALAWVLAQGDDILPLIGARSRQRLSESLGALSISLDADDLQAIDRLVPQDAVAGDRYAADQMAMLDSEGG